MANTLTPFTAYDVFKANAIRIGFTDPRNPGANSISSENYTQSIDGRELYMEFDVPVLTSKGLPDSVLSYDGMGVEVHVHLGARASGQYSYSSNVFALGICKSRVNADYTISYNNLPERKYNIVPGVTEYYGFSTSDYDVGGWWVELNKNGKMTLVSYTRLSPVDVLYAIANGALCIKFQEDYQYVKSGYLLTDGTYAPYVEIFYGIRTPSIEKINPKSSYMSPYTMQTLTWEFVNADGYISYKGENYPYHCYINGSCQQKDSTLHIKPNGASSMSEYQIDGETNSYIVPQDVLDAGGFEWSVGVTNEFDAFSGYSDTATITTVDSIPSTVVVAPKNTYVNASEAAVFEWQHVISTGSPQNKYELQALVGGEWQTLEEKETALTSAVIPAEQLSSTITAWRVRTANNDGVYGEFSDPASVVLIVAPHVSGVAVTGNVLPVVSWQSDDQQGYEVMVDDTSSGVHYGTQKSYAWQELLADGAHTVKVRAVNRFGLFSEWVSVTHTVANAGMETAPVLTAVAANGMDVELRWTGAGYSAVRIYRDGALLDKLTGYATQYTDHTATGRHVYSVRVSDASGNYADSAPAVADPRILDAAIAVEGVWDWVRLVYAPGADAPQRSVSLAPVYALNYYSGRTYPAVEMSAHRSATYSVTYALDDAGDAERLRGMLGRVVVHKRRGELLRGLLQSVSEARACWGEEVTLAIVEVSGD